MPIAPDDPRLTAFALGELDESERPEVEALIADDPEAVHTVAEILATARLLTDQLRAETTITPGLAPEQRQAIETRLETPPNQRHPAPEQAVALAGAEFAVAASLLGLAATLIGPSLQSRFRPSAPMAVALNAPQDAQSSPKAEFRSVILPAPIAPAPAMPPTPEAAMDFAEAAPVAALSPEGLGDEPTVRSFTPQGRRLASSRQAPSRSAGGLGRPVGQSGRVDGGIASNHVHPTLA